jgi:hypothetical protein
MCPWPVIQTGGSGLRGWRRRSPRRSHGSAGRSGWRKWNREPMSWGHFDRAVMGVGEPEGGATAQNRGACGASPASTMPPGSPNRQGKINSPSRRLLRSSRTKKGARGEEAAGANAEAGADVDRVLAVPKGGAAVAGFVEPRATAHQLPAPLAALTPHQIPILFSPWLSILGMPLTHGVGMQAVFTPLKQLPVQLCQASEVHQAAETVQPRLLGLAGLPATTPKGVSRGVVPRPTGIQRVAEMEWRGGARPAGPLPLVHAR